MKQIVYKVGDRYFYAFSGKKVQTAHSLMGAYFIDPVEKLRQELIEEGLTNRGKKFTKVLVELREMGESDV